MSEQITETQMHHFICAWCDNLKCVRGTDKCEFEQWKKRKLKEVDEDDTYTSIGRKEN